MFNNTPTINETVRSAAVRNGTSNNYFEILKFAIRSPIGPFGPMGPRGPLGPMGLWGPLGPWGPMGPSHNVRTGLAEWNYQYVRSSRLCSQTDYIYHVFAARTAGPHNFELTVSLIVGVIWMTLYGSWEAPVGHEIH